MLREAIYAVCSIQQVLGVKVRLMALQESLLALEADAVEVVADLVTEFDRSYSEMAEANKLQYNAYFTLVGAALLPHLSCNWMPVSQSFADSAVVSL